MLQTSPRLSPAQQGFPLFALIGRQDGERLFGQGSLGVGAVGTLCSPLVDGRLDGSGQYLLDM